MAFHVVFNQQGTIIRQHRIDNQRIFDAFNFRFQHSKFAEHKTGFTSRYLFHVDFS